MLRIILILPIALAYSIVVAQNNQRESSPVESGDWYNGSILTTSNQELKGMVRYNDHSGSLSFQDDIGTKEFSPRSVTAFEFFDESVQRKRVFYTFDDESSKQSSQPFVF